jgi:hypothetical protein
MVQRAKPIGTRTDLAEAIALLINNQAAFLVQLADTNKRFEETRVQGEQRFARIEADLHQIKTILRQLPETIRQKIGFQAPQEK